MEWIFWFLIAGVEIGFVTIILIQKSVLDRVSRLSKAVNAIGESGALSTRVEITGRDELGSLEESVNGMLEKLEHAQEALRLREQQYRGITENLPVGVALLDRSRRIVASNNRLRTWFPALEQSESPPETSLLWRDLRRDEAPHDFPEALAFRDGAFREATLALLIAERPRTFRVSACPIFDRDGSVRNVIELLEDVTEREHLQQQMQRLERLQAVGTLAAGVAHEINNPLNVIRLTTSHLEMCLDEHEEVPRETLEEKLGAIRAQIKAISDIVSHMRSLVAREAVEEAGPVGANRAVEEALSLVRTQIADHGIRLEVDLADDLPPVRADPLHLQQVIINLAVNALQALEHEERKRDGKCIRVATRPVARTVELLVEDNGPGLGEAGERIFDPFFTTKEVGRGLGLGLSLVHAFVTSWDGRIEAGERDGGGTRFTVFLQPWNDAGKAEAHADSSG